jgi:FMN phosphatase YigB (HAD superfamily)
LAPEQTLFIDDMPVNVTAAQALGWSGIHLSQPEQLAELLQRHFAER